MFKSVGGAFAIPTAMTDVEREFFLDISARERLVRPAAKMRLAFFDDAAVIEHRTDVAGEIVGIWIVRIDAVDFGRRYEHGLVAYPASVRPRADTTTKPIASKWG